MLNFTWWVNIKDVDGDNVFEGGFLGMDNIGVFDRNAPFPAGGQLAQSDGTAWMGMYCLNLLRIALELAVTDATYEDLAMKLFQHFLYLADGMNQVGDHTANLWDERDGFYYDVLHLPRGQAVEGKGFLSLKVRSMSGLVPLYAVELLEDRYWQAQTLSDFADRFAWFMQNRPQLTHRADIYISEKERGGRLLSLVNQDRLVRILQRVLDPDEFLGRFGIRALSKAYQRQPYEIWIEGQKYTVPYEPAESGSGLFGGNSNWRGPIWLPVNYLLIEALGEFHRFFGDDVKVECPKGSGTVLTLADVAGEIRERLLAIFLRDPETRRRPLYGGTEVFQSDPHWQDYVLFFEYFHGDVGAGLGASHQTGWTSLVAELIQRHGESRVSPERSAAIGHPSRVADQP
jgi:hypothetical protein